MIITPVRGWAACSRFVRRDDGQDLIEYAFLAAFIALAALMSLQTVASAMTTQFSNIGTQLTSGS